MRRWVLVAVVVGFLALLPAQAHGAVLDTGYRPDRDGFGFANFGDPGLPGSAGLKALVPGGLHDEIFSHTGHCFGMAEASVANFLDGNASIFASEAGAMPAIDRAQTGQSFYYIADFFRAPLGEAPDNGAGFAKLCDRLSAGRPAVLGIYSSENSGPGHAVVAYRVDRDGEDACIYVYDPNLPPTLHDYDAEPLIAVYDAANGTFSYDNGRTFDEMKVDDLDGAGVELGKSITLGLMAFPMFLGALVIRRHK